MDDLYNADLQCELLNIEYDFIKRTITLRFPDGDCCDMGGAIRFAKRMFPDVRQITTYSGDEPDTEYLLADDCVWHASWRGEYGETIVCAVHAEGSEQRQKEGV